VQLPAGGTIVLDVDYVLRPNTSGAGGAFVVNGQINSAIGLTVFAQELTALNESAGPQ
jgi:hypothetical protein